MAVGAFRRRVLSPERPPGELVVEGFFAFVGPAHQATVLADVLNMATLAALALVGCPVQSFALLYTGTKIRMAV